MSKEVKVSVPLRGRGAYNITYQMKKKLLLVSVPLRGRGAYNIVLSPKRRNPKCFRPLARKRGI